MHPCSKLDSADQLSHGNAACPAAALPVLSQARMDGAPDVCRLHRPLDQPAVLGRLLERGQDDECDGVAGAEDNMSEDLPDSRAC